ncbi:MAG: uroporphyrinogen decarboxylase [Sulfobacillus acidophilus]|uniref:Uroporphyrinogen decarboxylase n=1 Tax=Sulfobacillus acidophilus TaxID=53633 RepID=A0A2T2WEI6_9FIRM|nr:MAG: uroporphyrinogen decarboxylase [Sulfobacillus acidophilus]
MVTNSRFIRACRGEPHDTVPVWFMRQAGRYQPTYRALRSRYRMLDLARSPNLIRDVTISPVRELGVDAAILFSDIMIPLTAMGVNFDIQENVGPVVFEPIRGGADVRRLSRFVPELVDYVFEGVRLSVAALEDVPLIGFSGAPFTLASYLVEGGPSRTYRWTKDLLWNDRSAFDALLEGLAEMVVQYLTLQAKAGASALQIFDSWVGALSAEDYREAVWPVMCRIFAKLQPLNMPLIYFGVGTQHLLEDMGSTGATVIGVDWRIPMAHARKLLGPQLALMGNLDPQRLVSGRAATRAGAHLIMKSMQNDTRYIFNLGHGVPKETDPAVLKDLVRWIHAWGRQGDDGE